MSSTQDTNKDDTKTVDNNAASKASYKEQLDRRAQERYEKGPSAEEEASPLAQKRTSTVV